MNELKNEGLVYSIMKPPQINATLLPFERE